MWPGNEVSTSRCSGPMTDRPGADVWLAGESDSPALVVVGVPYSSSPGSGMDLAPLDLRSRLSHLTTRYEDPGLDIANVPVLDVGNWPVSKLDDERMRAAVRILASQLPDVPLTIYLGGDAAITPPLVDAESDDPGDVGLITFHARHQVDDPNGPVRLLLEGSGIPGSHVVQFGIHPLADTPDSRRFCDEAGVTSVTAAQIGNIGITAAVDVAIAQMSATCHRIFVNVDFGVLDPTQAPGAPGANPGGLLVRQLAAGVARCAGSPRVTAIDIVGVDPSLDPSRVTIDSAAHVFLSAVAGFAAR